MHACAEYTHFYNCVSKDYSRESVVLNHLSYKSFAFSILNNLDIEELQIILN